MNVYELTQEMMMKAMQCKDADELIALAKAEGKEITKEDAEACLDKMGDFELDENVLENVAGGVACAIVR